jgi:hypothetical protein
LQHHRSPQGRQDDLLWLDRRRDDSGSASSLSPACKEENILAGLDWRGLNPFTDILGLPKSRRHEILQNESRNA